MEDFDKLMWGDFDYKNRDFPEEATERMNEQRFAREYTVYKMGDLVNKIITLDKKFELPFNSILHVLDNVSYPDNYQDAPRVDENEFIQRESGRKFIYHIRELDTTGPIVYPDKFILRFAGLPTTLMKFRQQQGSNFRYLNKIEEFPTNNLYLIVINHNPLFRMRMYGRLPYFRIMQQILASVFNTCDKLKYQHRHQFILLPWSSEVYDKSLFIRSRKALTPSTVRKPNSFHYIFMMHLVNFLWEKETTSMLEKLDDETLAQINIILKHNDKYLIFNLKKIKDFNAKNIIYYRFVNQLNLLALMGSEEAEKHQDTINQLIEENKSETENTTFEIKSPEDKTELDEVHQDTVINKLVSVIKPKKEIAPVRAAAAIKTYVPQPKEVMREVKPSGEQVVRRVAIVNKIANVSTISTKETKDTYAEEYVKDLDTETNDFIDNDEDLTPAAKQHFKKLAAKYKECKVDGVYISKLLLDHSDIGLEKEVLDDKVVGFAPDKSALESSTDTFEKSYREKTFKKHFAGVISSFQNKGVFLTDVKQEVVADPLNNYTLYTCSYEDIHSKKSTIKIKIPNIDSNDRFIADGNPMVIKKQRCALPIIKINDHEVALASNYNKTRVVRNTTKAHSFTGYVESFVNNKDKSTASIIFGNLDINEPISYEYCMMAKRFNEITFTNKDKFVLVFDYYHRLDHVKPSQVSPEKVEKLENNYGTFFGYNTNDIFFIDNTNQVFAVNKKNFSEDVDFPYTSLLDLLKLSLRDGIEVKKALSEFLTIKILNAELPVMIMLAYRYGLRRMLDYIGIEYYITENRSKTIVSESTSATEAFDIKPSLARVQYLNELNKSGIDKNKIIIGASAALVAYGLLDTPNKDLDISIEDNYKKTLINKGVLVRNIEDGATHWVVSNTHIDAGVDGPDQQKFSYTELKKLGVTIINGYTFISLEGMIKFYEKCKELFPDDEKKQQKYDDRIALIEQALDGTAGTESFGVNSDRVAGSDELEILYGKDWIKPRNDSKPNIVITNRRAEQDETDYEILQNDRNKNDLTYKSVFGLEGLDRPVKPRLGKIHFYITVTSTGDELNPSAVKIRGMLIEVKLGQSHAVMRRVLNYDGITFRTQDPQKLSKSILEKASDYLHCTEHKIKSADITVIPNAAPLPQDVAKARPMTAEEYAKVTSKLNNEETRVGGNESFDEPMISSEKRYEPKPNDIHIKFADRVLHFNRYPLDKSLIVAGLDAYDLTGYSMADFEGKDAYFSLFAENGLAVNYLKGIDSFYDLFVDNMTYTVLKQMHEPTNVRDLLLRCGVLLSTVDHREASSGANHRIRGYEQFNAILYNEMSREFAGYQARRSKNNAFSINPKAVYLRIVQNESTMPAEASNPLEDIKMYSNITYGGIGGRTGESFVTNDRRFAADDIGVLSEATADSGKVGMNAMLSFDPTIVNTLGVCESKDPHTLKPANVMSIHSLCMPFANTDDPPRVNFNSIQSSHLMGTEYVNKNRVRTGYERVVAHRVSDNFAAVAEKDGKVTKIDHEAKLMEVTYNDGTKNVFRIDDQYEYAESIVIQQNLVTNFKVGDKFKKQDVLTYNKNFFTRDNFTGQADYTTGVMTNVAFIETDTTLEDSTEISEALSKKLAIDPVNPKVITLSAKSKVYKALSIGDKVEVSTPLMIFEEDPVGDDNGLTVDESTVELLGDLNRATPTAGYSGEIVHIDAYYGGSISNMNPSVAKLVNAAIAEVNAASKLASGSMRANEFIKSTQVPIGSKFKGIEFDEDTVMFIYYIKERIPHSTGDKLVLCNQLKATTAAIFPKPVQTESGVPVDMFFSQRGVNARKCLSPFLTGIISRIMEKTEKNIIKDYFG